MLISGEEIGGNFSHKRKLAIFHISPNNKTKREPE